jgi:hypothetical protein
VVVAVHDAGPPRCRPVVVEPGGDPVEVGDVGAGIAVELAVAVELAQPAGHLALEEAVGLPEAG